MREGGYGEKEGRVEEGSLWVGERVRVSAPCSRFAPSMFLKGLLSTLLFHSLPTANQDILKMPSSGRLLC